MTQSGYSGFVGLSLRLTGRQSSVSALAGWRRSSADSERGNGPAGALGASWNSSVAGGRLAIGTGLEYNPERQNEFVSAEFDHRLGSVSADAVHVSRDLTSGSATQYTLGFQTTLVGGSTSGIRAIGKSTTESMIVTSLEGARSDDRFEVLVDERPVATLRGTESSFIKLPAYRAYKVRIRPLQGGALAYDGSAREVGLYPGSVAHLDWLAVPVLTWIGTLVDQAGRPLRRATLTGKGVWTITDDEGYFQLDAPQGAALEVAAEDGTPLSLELPDGNEARSGLVRLGHVVGPFARTSRVRPREYRTCQERRERIMKPFEYCRSAIAAAMLMASLPANAEMVLSQIIVDLAPDATFARRYRGMEQRIGTNVRRGGSIPDRGAWDRARNSLEGG